MNKLAAIIVLSTSIALGQIHSLDKPRIYVSDSASWESVGGFSGSARSSGGGFAGGARPQTVEIIKTFNQRCPAVLVTMDKTKADYIVLFDREGGKSSLMKRDKIAVFKKEGDILYSDSARSVGKSVENSCDAIILAGVHQKAMTSSGSQTPQK